MRVLLVEDAPGLGEAVREQIADDGHAVDWVQRLDHARNSVRTTPYDLILLDLMLPDGRGLDFLRQQRSAGDVTPVIILTAQDQISDRIAGLNAGADDYLVKPFDVDELEARLRALLRRAAGRSHPVIRHGALEIDPAAHTVLQAGVPVELSPREFAVLLVLLESRGRVQSRQQLEARLYNWQDAIESNALEVHIHHLRRKLGSTLIHTMRGVGYFIPRDEAA